MSAILQQRAISTTTVDLCYSMDLIAFVTNDGMLAVHRTISWEKVFERKCSEICSEFVITCIKFSLNGRYLALGFQSGDIRLVELENSYVSDRIAQSCVNESEILRMSWVDSLNYSSASQMPLPLFLANGRDNLFDQDSKDEKLSFFNRLLSGLNNSILFALTKSGDFLVFAYGSYLIFTTNVTSNVSLHADELVQFKSFSTSKDISILIEWKPPNAVETISAVHNLPSSIVTNWSAWQRAAFLHLMMEYFIRKLDDSVINLGKKWKECNKMIPAKISLLQGLLSGYEMKLNPIQYYHTVALCGLWHPSSVTSFSSHWNDQGISRFRASVIATCKFVLRNLQFKIIPLLINIYLIASEYQSILTKFFFDSETMVTARNCWKQTETQIVYALLAAENTLFEGKYARESMLLYVQFVKDCFLEASQQGTEVPTGKYSGPDLELRQKCQQMFQPREDRPVVSNPEYITGTHLFAHFQEYSLPVKNDESIRSLNLSRLQYVVNQHETSKKAINSDELIDIQQKLENLLNMIGKDTFHEMNLDFSKPLFLFNQTKKLSSTYNQQSGSMMLKCIDAAVLQRCHELNPICGPFDSAVVVLPFTIQLREEKELVLPESSVRLVRATTVDNKYLYVTVHDLREGTTTTCKYGAKVSLLYPRVYQVFLYDRAIARANLNLANISMITTTADQDHTSNCSILVFYHNDNSNSCEVRKYPISELEFCQIDSDSDAITGASVNEFGKSSVPVVLSDLSYVQPSKISRQSCCINPPRGVLFLRDIEGKFVIIDAEATEEDDESEENETDESESDESANDEAIE